MINEPETTPVEEIAEPVVEESSQLELDLEPEATPEETVTPTEEIVEPTYTPNLEYKVYGKTQTIEDEWATGLFTKDNEEHFKKLYERAGGFDQLKSNYKDMETNHGTLQNNFNELDSVRNDLVGAVQGGNLSKAMEILNIKEQDLFQYVQGRLDYHSMPNDQRQVHDQHQESQKRNQFLEHQVAQHQVQQQDLQLQQHNFNMQQAVSTPEAAPMIQQYNSIMKDDNAFNNMVRMVGEAAHAQGKYLEPKDAVAQAMMTLNLQAAPQAAVVPSTQAPAQVAPVAPPVLNGGSSASVVKKRPSSIEAIQNEYARLYEN